MKEKNIIIIVGILLLFLSVIMFFVFNYLKDKNKISSKDNYNNLRYTAAMSGYTYEPDAKYLNNDIRYANHQ